MHQNSGVDRNIAEPIFAGLGRLVSHGRLILSSNYRVVLGGVAIVCR